MWYISLFDICTGVTMQSYRSCMLRMGMMGLFVLLMSLSMVGLISCETDVADNDTDDGAQGDVVAIALSSSASDNGFDDGGAIALVFTGYGSSSFPKLSWQGISDDAHSLLLVIQDQSSTSWAHGIFVIDTSITNIPRVEGRGVDASINSADLSTVSGVNVVESYYAPSPPIQHSYDFILYSSSLTIGEMITAISPAAGSSTTYIRPSGDIEQQVTTLVGSDNIISSDTITGTAAPFAFPD